MGYQTEIDFALRVLQNAEDNNFSEAKMQAMLQQDADYRRVFLSDPQALHYINLLACLVMRLIKEEQTKKVKAGALYYKQERLHNLLEKAAGISTLETRLRQELQQVEIELKPFWEQLRSTEPPPLVTTINEMMCWFRDTLRPTQKDANFENELQKAIRQFYQNKHP
jgi:hypothetical protein